MTYSGLYRCSGCSVTFADPAAWREAQAVDADVASLPDSGQRIAAPPLPANDVAPPLLAGWGPVSPLRPGEPVPVGWSDEDVRQIQEAAARANKSKGRRR
jgi:hypothetical protein